MDYVLHSSTTEAENINRLHVYFYWAAGFIITFVTVATAWVVYKFRAKKGQDFEPKTLSSKWEIPLIGVPLLLVCVFFFMMLNTMGNVLPSTEGRAPDVVITGHQFWWEAQYPAEGVVTANEIHLPAGKKILVKLLSADVIHDWWVPQFGNKMDMISGRDNYIWINIKKPGKYYGACSEFCGAQHAGMLIIVDAQSEDDYHLWLQAQKKQTALPADAVVQKGAMLFQTKTCGSCHAIDGTNAVGLSGPNLTHLAGRETLLTGLIENNAQNLRKWIEDPQSIKPGANMPAYKLDKSSADALAAYLSSLK